jgi:hypothetical protein
MASLRITYHLMLLNDGVHIQQILIAQLTEGHVYSLQTGSSMFTVQSSMTAVFIFKVLQVALSVILKLRLCHH